MKIRSVSQLNHWLKQNDLSPEAFSAQCHISNMTIRRMMKKKGADQIPSRYWAALDMATNASTAAAPETLASSMIEEFDELASRLETEGRKYENVNRLNEELNQKSRDRSVSTSLKKLVKQVYSSAANDQVARKNRFLAIGALLYFLNPIDLIPDTTIGVGYLDDYAVLSLVAAKLVQNEREVSNKRTA